MGDGLDRGEREAKARDGLGGQIIKNHSHHQQAGSTCQRAGRTVSLLPIAHAYLHTLHTCLYMHLVVLAARRQDSKQSSYTYIHTSLAFSSASDCTFAARHARIDPDQEESPREPGNTTPGISAPNLDQAKAYLDVWK